MDTLRVAIAQTVIAMVCSLVREGKVWWINPRLINMIGKGRQLKICVTCEQLLKDHGIPIHKKLEMYSLSLSLSHTHTHTHTCLPLHFRMLKLPRLE